ncbi:hypothetical protein MBM_05977 [Drepanopeziza brunnea f. sp. 'multigermtubi' MB_m1]|uniref:Uncharacterized protein n=1 Tax=Marssonina brunnea f. sp. multigermtubi (strain MB_m1) TaxID=1072389 RepID=K1WSD2_MARBU|nr:uncharacterized protein MBM_05977 [Drepanopeziza brunnea f. sp. 'multigermtubi' MB_m1]EKD15966.1 hypothetical protein MBM_05977 [Drepanopeziza brunnea f. sp. 'multigermtubi' MB_m1]
MQYVLAVKVHYVYVYRIIKINIIFKSDTKPFRRASEYLIKESALLKLEQQATIEYFTTECFAIANTLTTSRILRRLREIATGDPTLICDCLIAYYSITKKLGSIEELGLYFYLLEECRSAIQQYHQRCRATPATHSIQYYASTPGNMQSIDPRGRQGASGTSARAQTTRTPAPADPFSKPAEPPSMLPNDLSTRNTLEALDEDASDLGFDLDSLPYSKPESHTKARLIIEDFLDIKSKGLRDYELWSLFRHAFAKWTADEFSLAAKQAHGRGSKQKGYANGLASIIQMEKEHQWTWEEQRAQQAAIEGFDSKWNDITIARLNRQTEEVAKIQRKQVERFLNQSGLIRLIKIIDEPLLSNSPLPPTLNSLRQSLRKEYEELRRQKDAIARDLDDLRNLTITRDVQQRKKRIEEATRHKEELEAAKAAKQSSRRSSRSSRDSLPSPEVISLELIRKENPANSLAECFEKLEKELRVVQKALRPGLRDDKSLADKLYSAYKNVLETTIARMNPASTSTAAIANIR